MHTDPTQRLTSRKLVKTGDPGIHKRGGGYVAVFRDASGKQRKRSARTLAEARALKASLTTDVRRGEYRIQSATTFAQHWRPWIDTYAGRTSRGFREGTRDDYRRDLEQHAAPYFGRMKLAEIEPAHVKAFLVKLAADGYAAGTIRNALAPMRAMLADASEDGLVRFNAAAGVRIPSTAKRPEATAKTLTTGELERLRHELRRDEDVLLVDFLVATGQRISEAMALDWGDVSIATCRVRSSGGSIGGSTFRSRSRAVGRSRSHRRWRSGSLRSGSRVRTRRMMLPCSCRWRAQD